MHPMPPLHPAQHVSASPLQSSGWIAALVRYAPAACMPSTAAIVKVDLRSFIVESFIDTNTSKAILLPVRSHGKRMAVFGCFS